MLTLIIIILSISFILYTILGGADFGAGIVETFAGRKGEKTITKSIAPVWEANHVWLILAIVILFTGFPLVYSTISTALHIPLVIALVGIVLRGSSFTFRHYDVAHDATHKYYSILFKVSSFIAPFFLGVILGAMMLGEIRLEPAGSFYDHFIRPWCNLFCAMMGFFVTSLFGYIAAVFLIGEASYHVEQERYIRISKWLFGATLVMGAMVFLLAKWQGHDFFEEFFKSPLSIISLSVVGLLIPLILYLVNHPVILYLRAVVGLQVTLILVGWYAMQFPILVFEKTGNHLTFYNTQAPAATLQQLLIALVVGLILILPSFYFLFIVFKKTDEQQIESND